MVKEFVYEGLVGTDWIGFKFDSEGNQYIVTEMISPSQYIVTYIDRPVRMFASREDLMHHYILNLHEVIDSIDP